MKVTIDPEPMSMKLTLIRLHRTKDLVEESAVKSSNPSKPSNTITSANNSTWFVELFLQLIYQNKYYNKYGGCKHDTKCSECIVGENMEIKIKRIDAISVVNRMKKKKDVTENFKAGGVAK